MSTLQSIRFSFQKIVTEQYAVIDGIFVPGEPITFTNSLEYNFSQDEPVIKLVGNFSFLQHKKTFVKLSVSCFFRIHEDDWKSIYNEAEAKFVLAKNPALHLGSLVVSLARGVLHAKTENQPFNFVVLPPVNLHDIITDNIEVLSTGKALENEP